MRVMIVHRGELDGPIDMAYVAECQKFNEEAAAAGLVLSGEGLKPSAHARRVRFTPKKTMVVDGPFAETREVLAGFSIWKVDSMEQAVEWVRRHPMPPGFQEAELDIYPLWEMEDFPAAPA